MKRPPAAIVFGLVSAAMVHGGHAQLPPAQIIAGRVVTADNRDPIRNARVAAATKVTLAEGDHRSVSAVASMR
ncbi:MAG: hypothetical protein ACRD2I_02520 [Vicinamibacterales bacterium]